MITSFRYWAIGLITFCYQLSVAQSISDSVKYSKDTLAGTMAYRMLHLPDLSKLDKGHPIVVAVIDDGFDLTHKALSKYYFHNTKEIPNNGIDDDNNGYVDDVNGWDAADNDNNVAVPSGKETFLYHGTGIMGIIIKCVENSYGSKAAGYIKIVPVKVMGDRSQENIIQKGYEGIDYAVKMGADIICCAWSGGKYDNDKYKSIFAEAEKKGIIIIAAAGNFYSEQVDPPASIGNVWAISSIDSNKVKIKNSNYERKVELVAAGDMVRAPHPLSDISYTFVEGTSAASALVTGCAAVLKIASYNSNKMEILAALKSTATPVDSTNRKYAGKLGAGIPNITLALQYLQNSDGRDQYFNPMKTVGDIVIDKSTKRQSWEITPPGGYKSIRFKIGGDYLKLKNERINFFTKDTLFASYLLKDFPVAVQVPGTYAKVEYNGKKTSSPIILSYVADPLDSTKMYCSDTKYFDNSEGEVTDGSGPNNYNNDVACKWQITVPKGKRVQLDFTEMDTQPNMDFVWLFNGTGTQKENVLAKFSGNKRPPIIVSPYNEVLVWFVTDDTVTAKGWKLKYKAVDDPAGVKERK